MTYDEIMKVWTIFEIMAAKKGITPAEIRKELQEGIDLAWASTDPIIQANHLRLFPQGKPSVEAFLLKLAKDLKNELSE